MFSGLNNFSRETKQASKLKESRKKQEASPKRVTFVSERSFIHGILIEKVNIQLKLKDNSQNSISRITCDDELTKILLRASSLQQLKLRIIASTYF